MWIYWNYNLFFHLNTNSNKLYLVFCTCMCACPCVSVCIWGGCTSGCASVWRSDVWCLLCFALWQAHSQKLELTDWALGFFFSLYPQYWDNRHVWESCLAFFSTGTEVAIAPALCFTLLTSSSYFILVIIPCWYFYVGLLYSLGDGCRDVLS